MRAIGLDVGSSSIKAAVLDLESQQIGRVVQRPFPSSAPGRPIGHFEVDPDDVVERCRLLLDQLLEECDAGAILTCGQHGGVVLLDESRRRLTPYISWRDLRASEPCPNDEAQSVHEALSALLVSDDLMASLGNELAPGGTVALLYWLQRHGRLPRRATPVGIGEYVLLRLADGDPVIEPTCAVGMIDVESRSAPAALYERVGLETLRWPPICEFSRPAGMMRRGRVEIPMFPVLGDHQCALAGAGLGERELSINVSTGSQVSLLSRHYQPSERAQARCYFDGLVLNTVTHLPAGRSLNVLVDLLTELPRAAGAGIDDPWELIARLIAASPPTDLRAELTFFKGPMGRRGRISNIGVDNLTVGTLFRAAFANMADSYARASSWLGDPADWDRIVLSGGLTQKIQPLRKEIDARFDKAVRTSDAAEETLLGLLRVGRVVCGLSPSVVTRPA